MAFLLPPSIYCYSFISSLAAAALAGGQNLRFTNDYRYFFTDENPYLTAFEELERTIQAPIRLYLFISLKMAAMQRAVKRSIWPMN